MQASEWIIDVENLRKTFPKKIAVDDVSLKVKKGEIFGFLGPNGSGKTTFIRMLCGLLVPETGKGNVLGFDILRDSYAIKCQTSYMAQHFSLYADLSIYENLDFVARIYNIKNRTVEIKKIIKEFNFKDPKQIAGTLSGGWKQRLALAASLLHHPKLLLLDEPTAGVDPEARREFWDHLHRLAQKGVTTLVSTHYMDEAERCNRLAYIVHGRILIEGTAEEIISNTKLITWQVSGQDLGRLTELLSKEYKALQTSAFGQILHVSSDNEVLLKRAKNEFQSPTWQWTKIGSSLEDIFVYLVKKSESIREEK